MTRLVLGLAALVGILTMWLRHRRPAPEAWAGHELPPTDDGYAALPWVDPYHPYRPPPP